MLDDTTSPSPRRCCSISGISVRPWPWRLKHQVSLRTWEGLTSLSSDGIWNIRKWLVRNWCANHQTSIFHIIFPMSRCFGFRACLVFCCFSRGWSRVWWNLIESSISHSLFLCGGGRQCYDDKLSLPENEGNTEIHLPRMQAAAVCSPAAVTLLAVCVHLCKRSSNLQVPCDRCQVRFPFICLVVLFWVQFSGFASCQGALAVLAYPNQQAGESCKAHAILRGYKRLGRSHCLVSSYVLGGCWITLE